MGALAAGVLVGTLSAYFFVRKREQWDSPDPHRKSLEPLDPNMLGLNHPSSPSPTSGAYTRGSTGRWGPYDVEPFVLPSHGDSANTNANPNMLSPTSGGGAPLSPSPYGTSSGASDHPAPSLSSAAGSQSPSDSMGRRPGAGRGGGNAAHVYVVHHDAGRPPPVTVFTSDGTEVVELPPQYESATQAQGQSSGVAGSGRQAQPPPLGGARGQPRALPAKMARVPSNGDPTSPGS